MANRRLMLVTTAIVSSLLVAVPARSEDEFPPQVARGVTVPVGFVARVFGQLPDLATSLAWGDDTATAAGLTADGERHHGTLLYVTATKSPTSGDASAETGGKVYAFSDEGGAPEVVADELAQPLGVVMGPDGTLYVSENPGGGRGRITALRDNNADGLFETRRVVIKSLPNGRHQTNGMTFGPDGMLYVANGNATDNGVECGPPAGTACDQPERQPWSGSIVRVNPAWNNVDLLTDVIVDTDGFYGTVNAEGVVEDTLDDEKVLASRGFRNIYDVDFRPGAPNEIWTPMNGADFPSSSEPLYALDIANEQVVGFEPETNEPIYGPVVEDAGFPRCLHDPHMNAFPEPQPPEPIGSGHSHPGQMVPDDNPDPEVQAAFGLCPKDQVTIPRAIFAEGHEGTSGLAFERGSEFPARYDGDLFVAEWGSLWNLNGLKPTGHKVVQFDIAPDGSVGHEREFMTGVLPMDITFDAAGAMFVADMTGQIYKVTSEVDNATQEEIVIDIATVNGVTQFVPQVQPVIYGQRVCWRNMTGAAHDVTSQNKVMVHYEDTTSVGSEINSPGPIAAGGRHCHTFDSEIATYRYTSTAAANTNPMVGTITVLPLER